MPCAAKCCRHRSTGTGSWTDFETYSSSFQPDPSTGEKWANYFWPVCYWPNIAGGLVTYWTGDTDNPGSPVFLEKCDLNVPICDFSGYARIPEFLDTGFYTDNIKEVGTRHAHAHMKLLTGGKSGSTLQNLFGFNASATQIVPVKAPSPLTLGEFPDPDIPVPFQKIKIINKALGNDGNLWVTLPNNSPPIDVTPQVDGVDYYTFTETAQKYTLHIVVNYSNPIWPDHVPSYDTYCVGEFLNFDPYWLPNPPPVSDAVSHWTLPGTFVNEQPSSFCDTYYDENASLLNRDLSANGTLSTYCWYVKDFQAQSASVGIQLNFLNGQTAFLNRQGKFNVYRPSIPNVELLFDGSPIPEVSSSGYLSLGSGGLNDMSFQHLIQTEFSGTAGYTQLITGVYGGGIGTTIGGYELDNDEWQRGLTSINTRIPPLIWTEFDDSPGTGAVIGSDTVGMDLNFKTYLRFQPDAGPGPNIFVTLALVTWGVQASATESAGVWTINPGSTVTGPSSSDSTEFPFWTDIFLNSGLRIQKLLHSSYWQSVCLACHRWSQDRQRLMNIGSLEFGRTIQMAGGFCYAAGILILTIHKSKYRLEALP